MRWRDELRWLLFASLWAVCALPWAADAQICTPGPDSISIYSTSDGVQRPWSGSGTFDIQNTTVKDMSGTVTAKSSTNAGNTTWTFQSCSFTISGNITVSSAPISGVTVDGGAMGAQTTDGFGNYSFSGVTEATAYTLTPSETGYSFSPTTASGTSNADATHDFTATLNTYTISGNAGVAAAVIDGGALGTVTADGAGAYSFPGVSYGTAYTITPAKTGYTFAPVSASGTLTGAATHNFTATLNTYTISGTIRVGGVTALAGVVVSGGALGAKSTNASGQYSFTGIDHGTDYTLTPAKNGYIFTPTTVSGTATSAVTADFTADLPTISGTIYDNDEVTPLGSSPPMKLSVNGESVYTTTAAADGTFSFTGVPVGSGEFVTIWLDTNGGDQASAVIGTGTGCTGYPGCAGVDLYRNQVVIDRKTGAAARVAATTLAACDSNSGASCSDADIGFTADNGVLTLSWATNRLRIGSGAIFVPPTAVTAQKLYVLGQYNGSDETLTLSGSGTSTDCTAADAQPLCVAGSFAAPAVASFFGTGAVSIPPATWGNLQLGTVGDGASATYTLTGDTTVDGTLAVGPSADSATDTLDAGSHILTLNGGGTPLKVNTFGSFEAGSSTVSYQGGASAIAPLSYHQLRIGSGSALARRAGLTLDGGTGANFYAAVIDQPNGFAYFATIGTPAKIMKVDLATFNRVDTLTLNSGENTVVTGVIDQANGFAYFATGTDPAIIVKINLHSFTREAALTLNPGEDGVGASVIDPTGGVAYFGTVTAPGIVVKVDLSSFTRVGAITLAAGENYLYSAVLDRTAQMAYFPTYTTPGRVVKIDLSTFTRAGVLELESGEDSLYSAAIDEPNGFAYFGTDTLPGIVVKVDLATFTRVGALTMNVDEDEIYSAVIDQSNGFAYFGTYTGPGVVVKVDLATFTRVGALSLQSGESYLVSAVIDQSNGFAYFGTDGKSIVKVDLSSFSRTGAITQAPAEERIEAGVIDRTNGYAYFATWTSPGLIVKVNLENFRRVGAIALNSDEGALKSAVIDEQHGFAYFGTDTNPGKVIKINLATFTRVGALTMNAGESGLRSAVIDQPNGFAYFGSANSPAKIVKINLSTFTRVGAITLAAGENMPYTAAIDQSNGMAYFATATSPGRIVKINLSTFSRVGAITLNSGENSPRSAIVDQANGFAYFGVTSSPGRVVKVNLAPFSRTGALTLNAGEEGLWSADIDSSNGLAYFGTYSTPGRIVQLNLSTFTRNGAATLNTGEDSLTTTLLDHAKGVAYAAGRTYPAKIAKIAVNDSHTFGTTVEQTLTVASDTTILGTARASTYHADVDLNGALTIDPGATFEASSSASLTIAGNFTNNGTFTPNSGTVTFDSSNACSITGTTMNNVVFDKQGGTATVSGTLVAAGNMTFTSAGSINGGGLEVRGNLSGADSSIAGTATMLFSGTAAQTYTAADIPDGDVTINKASGTLTMGADATWAASGQDLNITSGRFDQGASYNLQTGNVTVSSGAEWQNLGSGDIGLSGNVVNNGTMTLRGQ